MFSPRESLLGLSALGEVLSPSAHAIDALVFVLTAADFIQGRPDPALLLIWTQPGRRAGSGLLTVLSKPERLLTRAEDLGRQPRYIPPGNRAVLRAEWPKPVRHRGTWRRPRHHRQGRRSGDLSRHRLTLGVPDHGSSVSHFECGHRTATLENRLRRLNR